MSTETQIQAIEKMVSGIIAEDPALFLVETRIKPTNNVKVYLDGDNGITIEQCININRALYKQVEGSGLFPNDDFSLEVSSPGLDEPLKLPRQFRKNIGRLVEVMLQDGTKIEGKLTEVNEDSISVEEIKSKKPISQKHKPTAKQVELVLRELPLKDVKSTKIQITF
jgi:ribosome maturation factor RimP